MIETRNVTIGYNGIAIRSHLSYTFDDGKIYGILGESGIGKTTFLKTIAGLLKPIEGEIVIEGKAAENNEKPYLMHQQYTCFDWLTCIDNILITDRIKHKAITKESKQKAVDILESVGLFDHWNKYPTQLSGGQKQRLALARTLYASPNVMLMDEPLSALDESTRLKMQSLIIREHEKTSNTIIMITHSSAEAERMCDDIKVFY